jgi:aspartokinase/homoserine dehydrogenase 1
MESGSASRANYGRSTNLGERGEKLFGRKRIMCESVYSSWRLILKTQWIPSTGASVANAYCYREAAKIVEENIAKGQDDVVPERSVNMAVVVSAMGGKPKVTDLLLSSVEAAASRDDTEVERLLGLVLDKHSSCLSDLFDDGEKDRLVGIVKADIDDIQDILKTVALMKWQASRIRELVSGYGELWSAQILSSLLQKRSAPGHSFVYIDARRIITVDEDAIQDGAVVWDVSQQKLEEVHKTELSKLGGDKNTKMHFVITGYVASNTEGVATTLQRDGSDYSAAIMGRLLQSTLISIWTDVDGVLSADPRRVPNAHAVAEVSYNEAMELAYFGAKVIHPKTMQPAISCNPQIPIFIRNTFNPTFRGTRIFLSSTTNTEPDKCVCGFSSIDGMALINVEGSGLIGVHGVAKRLFGTLESVGVNVVLISQASSEHSITFATVEGHAQMAKDAIEEEFQKELKQTRISEITVNSPTSIIAAVGDGMYHVAGVSGRFFSALGDAQINVLAISQGCSERNVSAVVSASQSTRALRALHAAFRLSHTTVRVGVIGMNDEGKSLLRLLETQRGSIRETFDVDLQVCAVAPESTNTTFYTVAKDPSDDSITMNSLENTIHPNDSNSRISFSDNNASPTSVKKSSNQADLGGFLDTVLREESANHVIFDCTSDPEASGYHARWLEAGVHVVTANGKGLSGPKEVRDAIIAAERARGKLSAKYMREVTVSGAIPVLSTLRTLLTSGDKVRRVDGIFSVSMSYIMYRISPPPDNSECGLFDEKITGGAFKAEADLGAPCSFSEALKEAVSLNLMETDPEHDLSNEYTARMMIILAQELGFAPSLSLKDIMKKSDRLGDVDETIRQRVKAAAEKGCVLRHVASVDVKSSSLDIKILEVPYHHVFAVTPPTSACVRFFTHRYQQYPLVVQGPAAGADCTSSALLAEVLSLMSNKIGSKSGSLGRTGSHACLK